jgi:GNAT superfamily N-acetyltransferase
MGDFSDEKLLEMMKAPLTGEEVAAKIADLNANGVDISSDTVSREEFIAYDEWRQKQHFNFWGAVGEGMLQAGKEIGGGAVSAATDWKKVGLAVGLGFLATPVVGLGVAFGSSLVEGFARGTRDLGGLAVMAANHPDSPLYRMFVNPTGDKDVAYQDFLDLANWNAQSEKILAGKTNVFMPDKQTYEKLFGKQFGDTVDDFVGVNKELATAASYVLDPTTFMTFGGGAAAKTVATKAGAAAIKSGHAGSAVGHAVAATAARNAAKATFLNSFGETMIKVSNAATKPIDAMFDAVTGGMERLTGVKHNVSPINGEVRAQRVHAGHGGERGPRSLTHALMGVGGVYSAFSIPYALPITSVYAGLKGVKYIGEGLVDIATKGAKNADSIVGNAIRASSPLGIYMNDLAKTMIHGGIYGGAIGYATAGEEGAAGGIGTGVAIGAIGHNVGYAYGTISGNFAKEALYKEFDGHMETLKGEGELLKRERVTEFIAKITAEHGEEEGLRAISHIMALEKSKNVTVAYMTYDDMVAAVLNDPNMVEETPMQVKMDTLKPISADANISPNANQTNTTFRQRRLSPMGQTLADAIKAKSEGGQGWNGMFTTQHPVTGEKMTKPYALFKNGETGKYHIIINTDNVQGVRDAAGNVIMRYGPEGKRPNVLVPEGGAELTFEPRTETVETVDAGTSLSKEEVAQLRERTKKEFTSLNTATGETTTRTQFDFDENAVVHKVGDYLALKHKDGSVTLYKSPEFDKDATVAGKPVGRFKTIEEAKTRVNELRQHYTVEQNKAGKWVAKVEGFGQPKFFETKAEAEAHAKAEVDKFTPELVGDIVEPTKKTEVREAEVKESEASKNFSQTHAKANLDISDAFDRFVKHIWNKGKPEDLKPQFTLAERFNADGSPSFEFINTMNDGDTARAWDAFSKTDIYKKLDKANMDAWAKLEKSQQRDWRKSRTPVTEQKLKTQEAIGPQLPKWAAPVTKVATTAPLGELWHAMNQVYREVNHKQTITSEVRSWLLDRAFANRADTVKFMHEVYRRIGGSARDINAENGNWMKAIDEFEKTGKIENPQVAESFNRFCEELGEAIFIGWEDGKPFDYVLKGGDIGFARGLVDSISDAFYNRALRDATNLGADIRTKEAFVDWFKRSKNSGVRIDPILADTFKDLVRFYNDKNMKNAGLGRTDLVKFTPAMIKEHATIYGYEQRLQYGPNGEVTGLKPLFQYNQEMHKAGKAMIQELAELAELDEAALNGLDFYVYNDGDDVDLAMNGMNGTLDTIGKSGKGFLFQSPDYKGMGVGLDDVVNAQKSKAPTDGIYAPRDAKIWGKRGRARTVPSGRMGADMKEAIAKGQHVVFRGIPTEKAFKIIEKYVPKTVAENVRMLAPLIADGGFSMSNVVNGKYLGFTQATRDGVILSREWGDSFSARDVTFVPYDMQFKVTLKDLKNPNQDYKQPHFRFNVRSVDIDVLNRRGTILWNNSPELQNLYKGLHEFKADIFKTMDEYSGAGEIPATDFFGADDDARLRRKHVVAAIGASPNLAAELQFSAAEAEWHSYQKRDRGAEQNNPWFWMHADGLNGLHVVEGEGMRMRMNEKGYYRAMVPTPTHEGAVDSFGNPMMEQMYQSPDPSPAFNNLNEERASLHKEITRLDEKLAQYEKFGKRGNNPSNADLLRRRRESQNRLEVIDRGSKGPMFQTPDELAELNYDALYGKKMGPTGPRKMIERKANFTPTLAGTRYDMTSEPWNAGFIGKWATQNGGYWQYAGKNGKTKKGDVAGHTTEFKIRRMSEGKGKYRLDVSLDFYDREGTFYGSIGGEVSKDMKAFSDISVTTIKEYQGDGYGNMMYSELLERLRALGVENFDGEVINQEGRPAGIRDNMFGAGNTYIMGKDWDTEIAVATDAEVVRRLQRKIDLSEKYNGIRLRSKINKSAFYQSPDAPIKMDIESMRSFHAETSDKPYDANRVAEGLDDPLALLKRLSKLEIFKKKSVRGDYGYAETWGAKNDSDAGFLASNFKYAAEKGDVFQSDALKRFVEQTTGSKDAPVLRHTLEEFVSSTNAGIDAYNHSFKTGSPVAFVATHGTVSPKLGGGDHRRNIPSLKPHNHFNGQQATSYAYSYGGPEFANGANAFPEGSQIRAAVGMQNPLVYNFNGEFLRDDIVSTLIDKAKREKRDGIVMLNAIDPRVSSNVKDNHYIVPKGNEHQIAVIDNSFGKRPNPRGLAGAEGSKMFQNPDENITLPKGIFGPNNPETVKIGRSILEKKGIPHAGGSFIVRLNPEKSFKVGMAYDNMKHEPFNPLVRKAYEAMAKETLEQYQAIVDAGYKAEMHYEQEEPYANSRDAISDIRDNKRLRVLATDLNFGARTVSDADIKENPLLAMSQYKDANGRQMRINDVFRFVHDFFGHSERGNGFGPIGEENAWDVHARMYSPLARRAMTSGTRGQNSWVNFVNESNIEINRKRDLVRRLEAEGKIVEAAEIRKSIGNTRFADQKIGLLPEWASKTDEELTPIEKDIYGVHQSVKGSFGLYQQPDGYEVNIHGPTSEQFSAIGKMAQQANKFGTSVEIKAPQDYNGYELLMAGDGLAQAAISPDGELGSVVRGPKGSAKDVDAVIRAALSTGKVKWLNGFDTILPSLYNNYGFEAVARIAFVDEYKPDGWDFNAYSKYNNGRPDVVFMALVGENPIPYERNGKHIPMVASYDDAVRLAKERNAKNGGMLFQNPDESVLLPEERVRLQRTDLSLKYADYMRTIDAKISKGEFVASSRGMALRTWLANNGPKNAEGKPMYTPISIGEKVKVGDTMVDMRDFDQSHHEALREQIFAKAEERLTHSNGIRFTPEEIEARKKKSSAFGKRETKLEEGSNWFRNLDEETQQEIIEQIDDNKKAVAKLFKLKKKKATVDNVAELATELKDINKDFDVETYINEETERLIEEEGVSPDEAKRLATEDAKKRSESIEFEVKNLSDDAIMPIEELRYYADIATAEEVARQLKSSEEKLVGTTIYDEMTKLNVKWTQEDIKTDAEYLAIAEDCLKSAREIVAAHDAGSKKSEPKERSWRFGGDTGDIEGTPPTVRLADLYKKYRNTEYFDAEGNPLQWKKKDGTVVKSSTAVSGAEIVYPPEIMEMREETDRAIKEIRSYDYNGRGISALLGLMQLWGFRMNPNIADKTFDPSYINFDKLMAQMEGKTEQEKMQVFLTAEGSLFTEFFAEANFTEVLKDFPELLDTTEEVISTIFRTYEFESGTFGEGRNSEGKKVESRDAMRAKFVDKYYAMMNSDKGSSFGVSLDEMFYKSAEDYASAKIRDKKKNFAKTKGIKVDEISHQEVKDMMREFDEEWEARGGKIMINRFFAPERPLDKDGKPQKGWKDKVDSIEKNVRERLRNQSKAAKAAGDIHGVLTEEQVKVDAKKIVYKLQMEYVQFMHNEANRIYNEQNKKSLEASKKKSMTAAERQRIRRETQAGRDPATGATGWSGLMEQNREKIKKIEAATAPKEEPIVTVEPANAGEDIREGKNTLPKGQSSQRGATIKPTGDATAKPTASVAEMQAEVKKVETEHRRLKHEAQEKQRKVWAELNGETYTPIPFDENAPAPTPIQPPASVQQPAIQPAEPVGTVLKGTLPAKPVPVVEAKDAPNVSAYEDVDITEPTPELKPKKKKNVSVEATAEVEANRKDTVEFNAVKPPEEVAKSQVVVEQVGPIGARSVQHQQAVKDVLSIKDNLTLDENPDGTKRSVATKDGRYVVHKGIGNNKSLYVWMAPHEDIYRGTPLEKRRIAIVNSYEEAQLAIREFDTLSRVLAEREGLNTSQITQQSAPVMTPKQVVDTAQKVAQQVAQSPTPPPATPTRKAHLHPEFNNAIMGVRMVVKMSTSDAKKMVEKVVEKLGDKATLTDIIKQVLLDRQALAAEVAKANEQFAAAANAGAGANPDAVAQVVITPSAIGLRNTIGAPRLHSGSRSSPNVEAGFPSNFNPSAGDIAMYKMLSTFRTHANKYSVGNGGQAEGTIYVNAANYAIVQTGPSKWRLFNPAKALMSVWDNEQQACDAIFKHYFKR